MSILPEKYRARRHFRESTFYLYAAGALLILLLTAQLVHGLVRSADANGLRRTLESQYASLEQARNQRDESARAAAEHRGRINRLLLEAEPTAFQAFILTLLAESVRPEVRIDEYVLELVELEDKSRQDYEVVIAGRASDEQRKGLDWILELQEILAKEERVKEVRILSSQREGPWFAFRMAIAPNTYGI